MGPKTDDETEDQVKTLQFRKGMEELVRTLYYGSSRTQGRKHVIVDSVYFFRLPNRVRLVTDL